MKAIIQRVTSASVTVDGEIISSIGKGLCVLVGIHRTDTRKELEYIAKKILSTRIFDDPNTGKRWDKSVKDANLEVLCVSQFTLYHILKVSKLPKIFQRLEKYSISTLIFKNKTKGTLVHERELLVL